MNKKWQIMLLLTTVFSLALALLTVRQRLMAEADGSGGVPALISFQGLLADSSGDPLADGNHNMIFGVYDAASGGTKIWEESQNGVTVSNGLFAVMLGGGTCTIGCPLTAAAFSSATRYLQTSVDTGTGFLDFPRQQLASVPYALQSEEAQEAVQAQTADSAPWSGLTGMPAGFADGTDDGNQYENVITVAQSGGDFTSVASAADSISDASVANPYLIRVMPGVYTETNLVQIPGYVHIQGSGANVTVVASLRSGSAPNNDAATIDLLDNSRVSNLTVRNQGTGVYGIALYSSESSRATVVEHVVAEAIGAGGTGHFAAYWHDANAIIRYSTLFAGGATGFGTAVNAAFGSVNLSGGFPQALIDKSILMGGSASNLENCNDPSGTGYGLQLSQASPVVRDSYICGGHRGIAVYTNGHPQIQNSSVKVSSTGSAFLFEISASGSISLANSGVSYLGNKFTGVGTGLRCVHTYDLGTYQPKSDGTTTTTACN